MLKRYKTVNGFGEASITEKKSKFIASVKPVNNEDEAQEFILELKKKYYDASHNVFAYRIYEKTCIERQSDDKEPGQTAGLPVLNAMRTEDVINAVIVVTRYFGGVLLGTGGLVRAYGGAAKKGLAAAGIAEKILYDRVYIITDYNFSGKIQYEILNKEYILHNTEYTDKVKFTVLCEIDKTDAFVKNITDISGASALIEKGAAVYGKWVNSKLIVDF